MRIDGLDLVPGSKVSNFAIESGTSFPTSPFEGQSFILTAQSGQYEAGGYTYLGTSWVENGDITAVIAGTGLTGGGSSGAVTLHIDTSLVAEKSDLVALLTKAQADLLYQPVGGTVDLTAYLKKADAISTYLAQTDAAATYLAQTDASSTYLGKTAAASTYLAKNDAASTYLAQNDAATTYLAKTDAATSYQGKLTTGFGAGITNNALSVKAEATPYDVGTAVAGIPSAGSALLTFVAVRAFTIPANFAGSQASAASSATNTSVFTLYKNGSSIGTITFAAAGVSGTFSSTSALTFAAGDVLSVVSPASSDATLADIRLTIAGNLQAA